jgi:hypothetical protein
VVLAEYHSRASSGCALGVSCDGELVDHYYTTVEDMLHRERNFGDNQLGGPDFMEVIHTHGILNDGEILNYAFGSGEDGLGAADLFLAEETGR